MTTFFSYLLPAVLIAIVLFGSFKRVKPYDAFTRGAKEAIPLCVMIFPYLIAIFILAELFRASGLSDFLTKLLSPVFDFIGIPPELTELVLLKPFSGSGSLALLSDIYKSYGADSYIARCASCIFGSSETVFYIAAVYFSSVKQKKLTKAIIISLAASFTSCIFACFICHIL